jgi:DNA-binding transcriptional regulator YiaG
MPIKVNNLEFLLNKLHKSGWNNEKIAKELDVNIRTISRWTSRETRPPKIALLALTLIVERG